MEIFKFLNFLYTYFLMHIRNNKMEMKVANILYTCRCEFNLHRIKLKLRREKYVINETIMWGKTSLIEQYHWIHSLNHRMVSFQTLASDRLIRGESITFIFNSLEFVINIVREI